MGDLASVLLSKKSGMIDLKIDKREPIGSDIKSLEAEIVRAKTLSEPTAELTLAIKVAETSAGKGRAAFLSEVDKFLEHVGVEIGQQGYTSPYYEQLTSKVVEHFEVLDKLPASTAQVDGSKSELHEAYSKLLLKRFTIAVRNAGEVLADVKANPDDAKSLERGQWALDRYVRLAQDLEDPHNMGPSKDKIGAVAELLRTKAAEISALLPAS